MSNVGRAIGLLLAITMFVSCIIVYRQTGDWVAAVFALGSLCYLVFFVTGYRRKNP